ncbi:MAG: ParB N-terminal domain-containing protein [Pseudomonadota bacterium]
MAKDTIKKTAAHKTLFKTLPLNKIEVPEDRSRPVDDNHALAISTSIAEHGQLTPVLVRATPNGKQPYVLVAGGHRVRAVEMLQWAEIDCVVFKGDKTDALLAEVSENVFRNDLSVLDRAVGIQIYRDAWEAKYGRIERGGDQTVKLTVRSDDRPNYGFSAYTADRLGVSVPVVERLTRIAKNITGKLRSAIHQHYPSIADNQSVLLKFCDVPETHHARLIKALEVTEGDAQAALDTLADKPKPLPLKEQRYQAGLSAFARLTLGQKRTFLAELTEMLKAEEAKQAQKVESRRANKQAADAAKTNDAEPEERNAS